jgi:hypothetical protein
LPETTGKQENKKDCHYNQHKANLYTASEQLRLNSKLYQNGSAKKNI